MLTPSQLLTGFSPSPFLCWSSCFPVSMWAHECKYFPRVQKNRSKKVLTRIENVCIELHFGFWFNQGNPRQGLDIKWFYSKWKKHHDYYRCFKHLQGIKVFLAVKTTQAHSFLFNNSTLKQIITWMAKKNKKLKLKHWVSTCSFVYEGKGKDPFLYSYSML